MWAVLGSALTARRGQAIIVALVALLACAPLAAAPWYATAAADRVEESAVAGTPVQERLITISRQLGRNDSAAANPVAGLRRTFAPAGFLPVTGGFATGELRHGAATTEVVLAHRDEVCAHLLVTGECPSGEGEVLVAAEAADRLDLGIGDEPAIGQFGDEPLPVRVVGTYQVIDPTDPYWGDGALVGLGPRAGAGPVTLLTPAGTLVDYHRVTFTYELAATPAAFVASDVEQMWADLTAGLARAERQGFEVSTGELAALIDRIHRDRRDISAGVGAGAVTLLLFTWFTLVVVLRGAVTQIRGDVGWWRLRGVPAGHGWVSALGQGTVPLLAGAAVGTAAGLGLGSGLAGEDPAGDARPTALVLALLLVGLAVVGGLVAVVATQLGTLRTSVPDLIRRVPARPGRWRRSLVDITLMVLAAAAVGQALTVGRDADGVALLAPGLAVLALALAAAWALPPAMAWVAARALRAGRVAVCLIGVSAARRSGGHRAFALVGVAVALVTTGLIGWDTAARAQWQRAAIETGADRVVTVAPVPIPRLLAAVRAADPGGAAAMAVVRRPGIGAAPPVLAVDTARLAVVAGWRAEYGGDPAEISALLRPAAPPPVVATTDELRLAAAGADPAGSSLSLRVLLQALGTGDLVEATFGPLAGTRGTYTADVPGCAAGCRLIGFELLGPAPPPEEQPGERLPPAAGTWVDLHGLTGADGGELGSGLFTDATRWRPGLGPDDLGPAITAGESGLRLAVLEPPPGDLLSRDDWVYVADAPAPLPVVTAGWRPPPFREPRLAPFAGDEVPVEVARTASLLPLPGGSGVLVDLEYAHRMQPAAVGGVSQVWLAPTAPSSIVDDLRAAGLVPLREESLAGGVGRLRAEGHAVAVRFQAAVALVSLLLAAAAVVVLGAQDRAARATELAALRAQGVGAGVVRAAGYGGLAVIAVAAVVGVLAGLVGTAIARTLDPGFVDGWQLLPPPPLHPYPVGGAIAVAGLVLGGAALAAAVGLIRRTREVLS